MSREQARKYETAYFLTLLIGLPAIYYATLYYIAFPLGLIEYVESAPLWQKNTLILTLVSSTLAFCFGYEYILKKETDKQILKEIIYE